jgi:putative ABC transport system permease protein
LKLGDTISFQIAEKIITAKIVQLRTVLWDSLKPNFFVIFPPGIIDSFPHSYITSIYLSDKLKPLLGELSKKFIEISIIDIDQILEKVRNIISNISLVLDILLGFVFLFGVLIMYASLLTTLKERLQESALIQILGANKRFVLKMLLIEFGALGFISSTIANIMVFFIARDIASYAFELSFTYNMRLAMASILLSTLGMMMLGVIGARSVFRVSPLWLLRQTS